MESDYPCKQETSPYVGGSPLGYCDHSSLMERDPK